ncbi:hypothetical protein PFISCL1PPCAC_23298, partial [Pristionchus fissidentatus]
LALLFLVLTANLSFADECKGFDLPMHPTESCTKNITWRVNHPDPVQQQRIAHATCLDYFPTYFVTAELINDNNTIICTVTAAFQCVDSKAVLIYDKCVVFAETPAEFRSSCAGGGKVPVIYSMKQAQFLAKQAVKLGIGKLWIGTGVDGMTIGADKIRIHSKMFNLIEDDYWDGDTLKTGKNAGAKYLFLRTRTDYELGRWQGHFEQATATAKAAFACEHDAKMVSNQKWYCDKMAALSIDAFWSAKVGEERCVYRTATKYTFTGTKEGLAPITGCHERPTTLHSNGMDDGTSHADVYKHFKTGTLRLAGYPHTQSGSSELEQRLAWRLLDHQGKRQFAGKLLAKWEDGYPKYELTDFPGGYSKTLALKNGKLIDLPPQVKARALCSLSYFQECENRSPCGNLFCTNTKEFQSKTDGFYTCGCPTAHIEKEVNNVKSCEWGKDKSICAILKYFGDNDIPRDFKIKSSGYVGYEYNDRLIHATVRKNCVVDIWAHNVGTPENAKLLEEIGMGDYDVPNAHTETLGGNYLGFSASVVDCNCSDP